MNNQQNRKGKKNRKSRYANLPAKKYSPASQKAYKYQLTHGANPLRPLRQGMQSVAESGYKDVWGLTQYLLSTSGLPQTLPDTVMRVLGWLSEKNIIAVRGQYDSMQDILTQAGLPCQTVESHQLPAVLQQTEQAILLCNCTGANYPNSTLRAIKEAMETGKIKTVVTTDWCIRSVFMPLFPGVVRSAHQDDQTPSTGGHCSVHCQSLAITPFTHHQTTEWWSEASSFTWVPENPDNPGYEVLAVSTQEDGDQALRRGRELAIRYYYHRTPVIHLLTHLKMKMVNESADITPDTLAQSYGLPPSMLEPILAKGLTPSTIQTLLTSAQTMVGLIVNAFAREALLADYRPVDPTQSQSQSQSVERQLLEMGKAILYPTFSRTVDHSRFLQLATAYLEGHQKPDFLLTLAKCLRVTVGLRELPARLLGLLVEKNSSIPEVERTKLRPFCQKDFPLTVRDLILMHEMTRGPKGAVKKILQRIFNDHWDQYTEKQLRVQMGSAYISQKHPVAPRELLKELLRGSHPKHSEKGSKLLRGKLPKEDNIVDVTSKTKTQEEYQTAVQDLLQEHKLTARQLLKNITKIALCQDAAVHQQAIQLLERSRQVPKIQPPDFTNAAISLLEAIFSRGFQAQQVRAITERPQSENICLICVTNLRDTVLLPCRHVPACHQCTQVLRAQRQPCPICRSPIEQMERGNFGAEYVPWYQTQPQYQLPVIKQYLAVLMQAFQRASEQHLGCRLSGRTGFLLDCSTAMRLSDLYTPQMALAMMVCLQTEEHRIWYFNGDQVRPVEQLTVFDLCNPSQELNVRNLTPEILEATLAEDMSQQIPLTRLIVMSVQSGHYPAVTTWAARHPATQVVMIDGTGYHGDQLVSEARVTYLAGYSYQVARELNPELSLDMEMRHLLTN